MKKKKLLNLTVKQVIQETDDTISILFEVPEDELFVYQPGQFLTLVISLGGETLCRAYSLFTSPQVDCYPGITIKRVYKGKVSNHLNDFIKPGSILTIMPAEGRFTTTYHPDNRRHLVFIGAGSGITPLMSMIKTALHQEPHTHISLLYANRHQNTVIYKKELSQLEKKYPNRFQVTHIFSQPKEPHEGPRGRITAENLHLLIAQVEKEKDRSVSYFLCGPAGLMETVTHTLEKMGISSHHIHKENFSAPLEVTPPPTQDDAHQVKVHYMGEDHEVEVLPGETILDAALDQGIDLPYSCSTGVCTVCIAKCKSGKVALTADDGLTEDELAQNYILTCVAHPLTDDVSIDCDEG